MEIVQHSYQAEGRTGKFKSLTLPTLGALISVMLILNGLVFRTYHISMTSPSWEVVRLFGTFYVLVEIGIIVFAFRHGLDLGEIWAGLSQFPRYCMLLFMASFWIGGAFYSEAWFLATAQNIIFLIHILFAVAVYHVISSVDLAGMRQTAVALAFGLLSLCAMTALAFLDPPALNTLPKTEIVWQYAIPGFISVRLFGAFCGAIFCFLLAQLLLDEEAEHKRLWPYLGLTLCAAMTIWSGTRNAVVGVLIATIIIMTIYRLRPTGRQSWQLLFVSLATATLLAISLIPYNDPNFMLIAGGDTVSADRLSGGRLTYWTAIWNAYQTVPLYGAGPFASFWILPAGAATHVQPHNVILQFLLTWGLPATMAAVAMLLFAIWKAHIVGFKCRNVLPFLAMLDSLWVMSFFDGTFHFAQLVMLIMIAFGVIFSAEKMTDARQSEQNVAPVGD